MYNLKKKETYRNLADVKGLALVKLNGKIPFEQKWSQLGYRNFEDLTLNDDQNAGVLTGDVNGIIVLDVDDNKKFEKALSENGWELPETHTVKTGSGGYHYYFGYSYDGHEYGCRACKESGFDIRANGGQVVAPGSIHPETGRLYEVKKDLPYNEAPQWLLELAQGSQVDISGGIIEPEDVDFDSTNVVPAVIDKVRNGAPVGQRSEAMWHVMLSLMSSGLSDGQILKIFDENSIGDKGREKGPEWLSEQIQKARQHHKAHNKPIVALEDLIDALDKSEQGDADVFRKLFRDKFCYDCSLNKWFVFNGITWEQDVTDKAFNSVGRVAEEYKNRAIMLSSRAQRGEDLEPHLEGAIKKFNDKSDKLNTVAKRRSVLTLARSGGPDASLGIYGTEWNTDPWILGCANGVIDLKTGQLRGGRPQDFIRIASPVTWKGLNEPAPTWNKFIASIFDNNGNLIEYIQRLLGYSLIGQALEHVMPVLWGKGRNGKSTLFNCMENILGDYASPIQAETLLNSSTTASAASHSSHLFLLKDRRLVWTSEVNDGRYFDASVVKRLTGGDKIVGRKAYSADSESFTPTHTIMMLTNERPRVRNANDYALFERLHLVPFSLSFVPNPKEDYERQADRHLEAKLKSESPGILAWLVKGCLKYQEEGSLNPPKIVLDATKEYQNDEDIFGHFLDDSCEIRSGAKESSADIYRSYQNWCEANGHYKMSSQQFHRKMRERFEERKSGVKQYIGVSLVTEESKENDSDF